jgi:hypothetical protein
VRRVGQAASEGGTPTPHLPGNYRCTCSDTVKCANGFSGDTVEGFMRVSGYRHETRTVSSRNPFGFSGDTVFCFFATDRTMPALVQ